MICRASLYTVLCAGDSPFDVGRAHGTALRPVIHEALRAIASGRLARGESASSFINATGHIAAMSRHTPELLEELQGIADGAGADPDEVAALSLMDEEWTWSRCPVSSSPGCTAVAMFRPSAQPSASIYDASVYGACPPDSPLTPAVLGQTMDLPTLHDGSQAVLELRLRGSDLAVWVVTIAGQLGLMGANSAGLGVVVNNLATLPISIDGLPVAAVLRGMLGRCRDIAAAGAFLASVPHATGQAYTVGDAAGRVCCWEADAAGVTDVTDMARSATAPVLVHGNHPVGRLPHAKVWPPGTAEEVYRLNCSHARCASAHAGLAAHCDPDARTPGTDATTADIATTVERLEQALSVAPVSVSAEAGVARSVFTFAACSFELSVPPRVRVAAGPPSSPADFRVVEWDWAAAPSQSHP